MQPNYKLSYDNENAHVYSLRLQVLIALLIILTLSLILRLGYLQFLQYKHYATLSLKNQTSIIPITPPRGIILDRNGVMLADNIPVYMLEIIPERTKNLKKTLQELQKLIPSINHDDIDNFNRTRRHHRAYASIPIKLQLSQEEMAIFASNQHLFPGISIKARLIRYYPLSEMTAHVLGYVGRINQQELKNVNATNYRATNFIGKAGIERFYEDRLHGMVGYQQIETDVSGRTIRVLSKQAPISGENIYLTIDSRLQKTAFLALKNKRGAAVAIDVNNGDILAMVSSPSYNPNDFVSGISHIAYQKLANAPDKPLYNRAVRGLYPPASTIKPFIALAGLEKGSITPDTKIYDPGWYRLPGISHKYHDWKREGHGTISLKRAITVSCDTYFYQLGNKIGISFIEDMLMQFGFGQLTHVDLHEEASGVVPSPAWKRHVKGINWYPGDTLITAIGQGFMLSSPLQLANAVAALSQHGKRFRPHLFNYSVQGIHNVYQPKPFEEYPIELSDPSYWSLIAEGMQGVIMNNEGTGYRFGRNATYTVAGKTGTAQVFSSNQYEKKNYDEIPETLRDHSLFIAFAPIENPKIAIAVIVENDFIASAIARKILDTYFESIASDPKL
ncbi:MAG: penicillin-binding protein 2 [Legionella sp.]